MDFIIYPDEIKIDLNGTYEKIFGRKGDVELEIGPGYDPFIVKRAKKFKDRNSSLVKIDDQNFDETLLDGLDDKY